MELYYRSVNIFDEKLFNDFSLEHLDSGTQILAGDASLIIGKSYHEYEDFYDWYKDISSENIGCNVYLVFNKVDDSLIGIFDIRYNLDYPYGEILGHIGVDIRPSMRGKGLYKDILKLCIKECESFGIKDIVISCEYDNIASKRGIEHHFLISEEMVPCNGSYLFVYKKSL